MKKLNFYAFVIFGIICLIAGISAVVLWKIDLLIVVLITGVVSYVSYNEYKHPLL